MRHDVYVLLAVGVMSLAGCQHATTRSQPFTDDWAHQIYKDRDIADREDRIGSGEVVLAGQSAGTRAAAVVDEDGNPKLNIGKRTGLNTDLRVNGGDASLMFKYKWGWQTRPEHHGDT